MDKKALMTYLSVALYGIGIILVGLIIVSWFVEYPDWLSRLLFNIMLVGLGIVFSYQAYRLRKRDKKAATIYLLLSGAAILIVFISAEVLKTFAVVGLAIFLLTRPIQKWLTKE